MRQLRCAPPLRPVPNRPVPSPPCLQIGITPTIPIDASKLIDIPLAADKFCAFAQTDAAPKLF